jgi:ubiquitin conjugation factor E4 B
MLINDSIYLLDEVISKIHRIGEIEAMMEDHQAWSRRPPQNRMELEQEHSEDESYVTTFCRLANETLLLLYYLSCHGVDTFLRAEMIDRLAVMLNYFMDHLVGPKSKQLKVKEKDKYNFQPRLLLSKLVEIYINLYKQDKNFLEAVIRDGRSFSMDLFHKATHYLSKYTLVSAEVTQNWTSFIEHLEKLSNQQKEDEQTLGEIPSEFLDPILSELMVDPVILPSGITVDRPVIERALLSSPQDPFSRKPLTKDMLVPHTELKQKIEDWKASVKKNAKKD